MSFIESKILTYSGISSETKPTNAAGNDVLNGSRWREVDTGKTYYFNLSDDTWYDLNSVQNPISVDGDSLYPKDIWIDESDIGDFSGSILDLVNDLHSVITNTTATDPKILFIHFNRTIVSNTIGLGAYAGNFSNVEIIIVNSGHVETQVVDESLNNTKYTTRTFQLPATAGFNALKIKFHTSDTVTLSNLVSLKTTSVVSRGQAVKPDGTVIDLNATAGGNQKFSLEELESGISSNSNSQLNITPFGSTGIEYRQDRTTGVKTSIDSAHEEIHEGEHFYLSGNATLGVAASLFVKLVTPDNARWGHFVWDVQSSGILTMLLDEDATGGMAGGARPTIHANNRNVKCWTGRHTGADNQATVLTDSTKSWTIDELIGFQIFNTLDGSSGIIVSNTADTVTVAALAGGTDNDFDTGDEYEINKSGFIITSGITTCTDYLQRIDNAKFGSKGSGGTLGRDDEIVMKQNTVYCRTFTSGTASNIINFKASWYEHINT